MAEKTPVTRENVAQSIARLATEKLEQQQRADGLQKELDPILALIPQIDAALNNTGPDSVPGNAQ